MKFSRESELYPIVKKYFEAMGYQVKGEVLGCDVMAVRDDISIVIELKLAFNLKLVLQASNRLAICDNVFIAIPDYAISKQRKRRADILNLMARLGVGVIAIGNRPSGTTVEILGNIELKSTATDVKLKGEFESRSFDLNTGGIRGEKLVTAYRERAIAVATYLHLYGTQRAADVKRATAIDVAPSIMSLNHYQWFTRVMRGHYQVSDKFLKDIVKYQRLFDFYKARYLADANE